MKKILKEPLLYLLPLLALIYIIIIPGIDISDVKLTRGSTIENIKLPYLIEMPRDEVFLISFHISAKKKSAKFNMVPDDCIQEIHINGKNFPLNDIKGLCDIQNGAYIDFSRHIQEGLNNIEVYINNKGGGHGGLRIETPHNGLKALSLSHYIFALLFLFCFSLILIKLKFRFIAISIILLGIAARLILYTYTGPMQYSHDMHGNLSYIQIMAEEKRVPNSNECFVCYQPPLYYALSSVTKGILDSFKPESSIKNLADLYNPNLTKVLQQMSLLFSFGSLVLGIALLINLFGNKQGTYLASLILALWPGFVLTAPRINNDILFYFGALFCMFFAQRYWRWHKDSDVLLASIGTAIAIAAKSTGFVILAVWIVIYIFKVIHSVKAGSLKILLASILIIALFAGLSNHRTIVNIFEGKKIEIVGNVGGLPSSLQVQNTASNYLYFDLRDYMLEPYVSPWADKGGRQYFWNYAIKTSLFGEFHLWNSPTGRVFATAISILGLFIFMLALWGIIHVKFKDLPSFLFIIFLFAALIYLRVSYPYSSSNDFRYIMPVLFPLVYFSVRGVQILANPRLRMLSYTAMLSFAGLSFMLIVGMGLS